MYFNRILKAKQCAVKAVTIQSFEISTGSFNLLHLGEPTQSASALKMNDTKVSSTPNKISELHVVSIL